MMSIDRRRFLATSGTTLAASLVVGPRTAWPNEQAMSRPREETSSFSSAEAQQQAWRADLFGAGDYHRCRSRGTRRIARAQGEGQTTRFDGASS